MSNETSMLRTGSGPRVNRRLAGWLTALAVIGLRSSIVGPGAVRGAESASGNGSRANGRDIVDLARKYKGARYKLGGESPRGFDCSGFTWYVYEKAAGFDIGRTVKDQWKHGRKIDRGDWKRGDIVFFENTFDRGLSHCGIVIRGAKFIHAENEHTGVVISSLDSDYYTKHYAGARRLL